MSHGAAGKGTLHAERAVGQLCSSSADSTDSSGLWDKALNCNSSSSHASPLCCPESIKGSSNPLLRPEASSPAALHAQTWGAALCHTGPFCKPISSASPVGAAVRRARHRGATVAGDGCVPWQCRSLPRGSCQPAAALRAPRLLLLRIPFLSGPHAASSLPASLPLFEYIKLGKTSYCTRNCTEDFFVSLKCASVLRQKAFKVDLFTSELSSPSDTCFVF